jgi:hypothetical protein
MLMTMDSKAAAKAAAETRKREAEAAAKVASEEAKREAKARAEALKRRKVEVREYKNSKEYEKDAQKRMRAGWRLDEQSAATFHPGVGSRLLLGPFARTKTRIIVTWIKDN